MKNSTKTEIVLKALDLELKKLLAQDLAQFKAIKQVNIQSRAQQAA